MPILRALSLLLLPPCLLAACGGAPRLRLLSSDWAAAPRAEPEPVRAPERDTGARPHPRIGAPGGSGAGARCVHAPQSGNETVGGLPAGMGTAGLRGG